MCRCPLCVSELVRYVEVSYESRITDTTLSLTLIHFDLKMSKDG